MDQNRAQEYDGGRVIAATVFSFLLATAAVSLRLWARQISKKPFSSDDYLIVVALVSWLRALLTTC